MFPHPTQLPHQSGFFSPRGSQWGGRLWLVLFLWLWLLSPRCCTGSCGGPSVPGCLPIPLPFPCGKSLELAKFRVNSPAPWQTPWLSPSCPAPSESSLGSTRYLQVEQHLNNQSVVLGLGFCHVINTDGCWVCN